MTDPKVILVSDALIARLKNISRGKDATKWFTEPGFVGYGPSVGDQAKPGPSIFVNAPRWSDRKIGGGMHEATVEWTITATLDRSNDPERDVHRLASDIVKVFGEADADSLGGIVIEIEVSGYNTATEYVEQGGRGEVVLNASALFRWSHSAP